MSFMVSDIYSNNSIFINIFYLQYFAIMFDKVIYFKFRNSN